MDGERDSLPAAREREGEIQDGVGYEGEGAELRKGVGSGEWGVGNGGSELSHLVLPLPTPHSPLPSGVSFQTFSFSLSSTNFLLMAALSFGVRPPGARTSSMMIQPW